ncbi:MAG TPA: alpha/beta hydrolase [Acidimicrobiales bacterium]|nr:alpha/beta hydrolase [Acidimicrobiales bacterium]
MQVQSSDGVTVAVHDLGGDGPPLIICHATGFCGGAYGPLAEHLAGERHVWALDFRGHGDSTFPDGERYDWDGAADDLQAVLAELTDEPIDSIGHSMGGAALMLVEARQPGTLRSAYLYEPIVVPTVRPELAVQNPMADAARRRRAEFPSKADALWRYATKTPLGVLNAASLAAYVEHGFEDLPDGTARLKLPPAHEAAVFEATGKATLETLASIDTPVAVAIGIVEEMRPAAWGPAIAEALVNGRLLTFPTLGHFGPLEDPAAVGASVVDWLSQR